jgi:hypothetical protein
LIVVLAVNSQGVYLWKGQGGWGYSKYKSAKKGLYGRVKGVYYWKGQGGWGIPSASPSAKKKQNV